MAADASVDDRFAGDRIRGRRWIVTPEVQTNEGVSLQLRFRAVSFNMLASAFCHSSFEEFCDKKLLSVSKHRGRLVMEEVLRLDPDIVVLQELDERNFKGIIGKMFREHGYSGHACYQRGEGWAVGQGIFTKNATFQVIQRKRVNLTLEAEALWRSVGAALSPGERQPQGQDGAEDEEADAGWMHSHEARPRPKLDDEDWAAGAAGLDQEPAVLAPGQFAAGQRERMAGRAAAAGSAAGAGGGGVGTFRDAARRWWLSLCGLRNVTAMVVVRLTAEAASAALEVAKQRNPSAVATPDSRPSLVLVGQHCHWDPWHPDLKAAQAYLAFRAAARLRRQVWMRSIAAARSAAWAHVQQKRGGVLGEFEAGVGGAGSGVPRLAVDPPAIMVLSDLNTTVVSRGSASNKYNRWVPDGVVFGTGVHCILTAGLLPATHIDHPARRHCGFDAWQGARRAAGDAPASHCSLASPPVPGADTPGPNDSDGEQEEPAQGQEPARRSVVARRQHHVPASRREDRVPQMPVLPETVGGSWAVLDDLRSPGAAALALEAERASLRARVSEQQRQAVPDAAGSLPGGAHPIDSEVQSALCVSPGGGGAGAPLRLRSAYREVAGREPLFSNFKSVFRANLDFIHFGGSPRLWPVAVLDVDETTTEAVRRHAAPKGSARAAAARQGGPAEEQARASAALEAAEVAPVEASRLPEGRRFSAGAASIWRAGSDVVVGVGELHEDHEPLGTGVPNAVCASDHLMVAAEFALDLSPAMEFALPSAEASAAEAEAEAEAEADASLVQRWCRHWQGLEQRRTMLEVDAATRILSAGEAWWNGGVVPDEAEEPLEEN